MMNALEMEFEDDTFDLVWACESGEHMPDKAKYVQEMTRVLKPGGPSHMLIEHSLRLSRLIWCHLQAAHTPPQRSTLLRREQEPVDARMLPDEVCGELPGSGPVLPGSAGGHVVIATWCQREETPDRPLTAKDKAALQFLYDEWAHPYFVSVQEYGRLLEVSPHHCTISLLALR